MLLKTGLKVRNGMLPVSDVVERLSEMRPKINVPNFDHKRITDGQYCVEWGMKRQQELERAVYNRYINELNDLSKLVILDDPEQEPQVVVQTQVVVEKPMQIIAYATGTFVIAMISYLIYSHFIN